jgi:hypothetical protein
MIANRSSRFTPLSSSAPNTSSLSDAGVGGAGAGAGAGFSVKPDDLWTRSAIVSFSMGRAVRVASFVIKVDGVLGGRTVDVEAAFCTGCLRFVMTRGCW